MTVRRSRFLILAFGLTACPVDDRTLELTEGAGGGGSNASGGAGSGSGRSGEGGEGADSSGLVDGCADLDTNGVADCRETLVKNPSFTTDVSDWAHSSDATLEWDPQNALDDSPSGSAKVSGDPPPTAAPRARANQCVALAGKWLVIAYASAFVESTDDDDESSQAVLEVVFFQGDDCSGSIDGFFETPPSSVTDEWTTIHAGALSKETTSSASVALIGNRAASDSELTVYFDNVMLKTKEP